VFGGVEGLPHAEPTRRRQEALGGAVGEAIVHVERELLDDVGRRAASQRRAHVVRHRAVGRRSRVVPRSKVSLGDRELLGTLLHERVRESIIWLNASQVPMSMLLPTMSTSPMAIMIMIMLLMDTWIMAID